MNKVVKPSKNIPSSLKKCDAKIAKALIDKVVVSATLRLRPCLAANALATCYASDTPPRIRDFHPLDNSRRIIFGYSKKFSDLCHSRHTHTICDNCGHLCRSETSELKKVFFGLKYYLNLQGKQAHARVVSRYSGKMLIINLLR